MDNVTDQRLPYQCEPPVFAGNPLVFRFDGELMLGGGVVQASDRLGDGI